MKIYINYCVSIMVTMILAGCDANNDKSVSLGEQIKKEVLKNDKGRENTTENVVVEVKTNKVSKLKKEIEPETSESIEGTVEIEETSTQSPETSTSEMNESTEKSLENVKNIQQESDTIKTNVKNDDSGCQVYNPITGGCEG